MPRTRSLAWAELRIGVLTIVALAIGAAAIFMLTGGRGFPWQRYHLKTRFASVEGLREGSPVRVAGVEVGSVAGVAFVGDEVELTLQINRSMRERITTGSTASLGSVSLLGESAVDLTASSTGEPIPEWGYVPQGRAAAALSDMTDQASQGLSELTSLIHDVRTGQGTVGKLMTDDALYEELHRFVTSASALTDGLRQGRGSLDAFHRMGNNLVAFCDVDAKRKLIVGVNAFVEPQAKPIETLVIDEQVEREQVARLRERKARRDGEAVRRCLDDVRRVAATEKNLMPAPPPLVMKLWRRFGFTALGVGLLLILLILYAEIFAYR